NGGTTASRARRKSTTRSQPRPSTSTSTTSHTKRRTKVRVAGPFTVESLSPYRTLGVDENDNLIDPHAEPANSAGKGFVEMILDNLLRTAGVQQAHKEDKIAFTALTPWPGDHVCAEGRYIEQSTGKPGRAPVFVGPGFGTAS